MRTLAALMLLATLTILAPATTLDPQATTAQSPAAPESLAIVIPAGTRIPMSLARPISVKSARPGTAVRAVTGFPVSVGTQLAIPAGTYVEGVIDKVVKHGRTGPELRMHFTRILYSNGYSVAIDGANVMARVKLPAGGESCDASPAEGGEAGALLAQSTLPTLPHTGPSVGTMVGIGAGIAVASTVAGVLYLHHLAGAGPGPVFDAGWQFEMVLQSPLRVEAASIAAAGTGER